ncbi:MAG TPA: hypothetical protein ENJ50_09615 [Planctomycetaceae bacterium]|nr:hypothetical protein [Planctomycetaceae bacterium]
MKGRAERTSFDGGEDSLRWANFDQRRTLERGSSNLDQRGFHVSWKHEARRTRALELHGMEGQLEGLEGRLEAQRLRRTRRRGHPALSKRESIDSDIANACDCQDEKEMDRIDSAIRHGEPLTAAGRNPPDVHFEG